MMKSLRDVDFEMRAPFPSNIELQFELKSRDSPMHISTIFRFCWSLHARGHNINTVEKMVNN